MARQYVEGGVVGQGQEPATEHEIETVEAPAGSRQPVVGMREQRLLVPANPEQRRRNRAWLLAKLAFALGVTVLALLHWDAGAALFLGLLALSLSGLVDGRVSVVAGLIGIASCPLLIIADQQGWLARSTLVNYYAANAGIITLNGTADQMAVWAYYFLCIGAVAQIARYARHMVGREKGLQRE